MSTASWTSPPASAFTFPISRVIRSVSAGFSCSSRRASVKRISPRFGAGTRRHRAVDVFGAGARKDANGLAGRRAGALEDLAGAGVHPLAADEVLEDLGRC